jgi:hypothetical protein
VGRRVALGIALLAGLWWVGCDQRAGTPAVKRVDLLAAISRAEKRPAGEAVNTTIVTLEGQTEAAVEVPATSRVVWHERLPDRAVLTTAVGVSSSLGDTGHGKAVFRIGISDERTYEELRATEVRLESKPRWQPVSVDLSKYGGFQWSLFYRPRQTTWRVVFNMIGRSAVRPRPLTGCSEPIRR